MSDQRNRCQRYTTARRDAMCVARCFPPAPSLHPHSTPIPPPSNPSRPPPPARETVFGPVAGCGGRVDLQVAGAYPSRRPRSLSLHWKRAPSPTSYTAPLYVCSLAVHCMMWGGDSFCDAASEGPICRASYASILYYHHYAILHAPESFCAIFILMSCERSASDKEELWVLSTAKNETLMSRHVGVPPYMTRALKASSDASI